MAKKILVNVNGNLRNVKKILVNVNGILKNVKKGFVNVNGILKQFWSSAQTPVIENTVELSKSGNYHNSTYPVTLTGKKYHFANANTFSYRFYRSASSSGPWTPMISETFTTNPSTGSSSNVTYQLTNTDFTEATLMYFKFEYTGYNTSVSPTLFTTSISNIITVTYLDIPAPPPGFPNINQSTISVASTASSGTWTGSPNQYQWAWYYNDGTDKVLTYSANKTVSSVSLSGTTATATVFDHGFKSGDSVAFSDISSLFNQSATTISSVFTNFFSYTVSKPTWSFATQYAVDNFVTYNGQIYKALVATPTRTDWSFSTNYTTGSYVNYNSQLYLAAANTPFPRSSWSGTTAYSTGQYVNYNSQVYQATGPSTNIAPTNPDFWQLVNIYPGGSYWTLVNIYPTSITYWQSQNNVNVSGGSATGPNYYEGVSSSPVSYTISSFPSTDFKTGTSLYLKTTRMAVTASNIAGYSASANSSYRTIYEYPAIFFGAQTITSTTASIIYAEAYMSVYDIDVKGDVRISSATVSGGNIVYTTDVVHGLSSGMSVTTSGLSPAAFNRSSASIISVTSNTFTVSNSTGATGSSSGTGSITFGGQPYRNTISGYPKTNQANSSPISITGLTAGSTYTVYVTPKNADSPRVSGIQKTTSFTTPQIPVNTVAPTISPLNNRGRAPVSTQLVSTQGTWTGVDGSTTYTYQWQYFENATIGWVNFSETGNNTNTFTIPSLYNGFNVRCRVRATNGSQFTDAATEYIADAAVSVGSISPTSVTQNQSTNFSFSVSGYPTSYTINWGDGSSNETYNVSAGTSSVNVTHAHTYTTVTTRTLTVTAQPGSKTNSANITISAPSPSASGFDRFNTSTNPSQPSVINFSSSNNQVTSTWTNGSPITSVFYTGSGAGISSTSLTDNTFPFVNSDLSSYSQSGTFTMNVFNYNDNMQVTFSWNQSNTRSHRIFYNHSVLGNNFVINGNNTGSSASAIANFTTAGTITWSSLTVYSGDNQTGTSVTYSNPTFSISVPRPESSRTGSVSLTYVLPKLATPTGVTASDNRTDGINITWNSVSGAAYYGVWYGTVPSYDSVPDFPRDGNGNFTTTLTGTSYLDTSMGGGVTRNYYVQAFRSGNPAGTKSDWSAGDSGTRVAIVNPPSGGTVTLTGNSTAGSVITASTSGWSNSPTSYDVFITTSTSGTPTAGSTRVAQSNGGTSCSYTITSTDALAPANIFRAFATASNSGGTSSIVQSTNIITATSGGSAPATPTGVGLTGSGVVSWTASSGATSYEIEFFTAQNGTGLNAAPNNVTGTGYTVTGISSSPYQLVSPYASPNNWARVRVRARNSVGASAYSAWVPSATTYT